MMEMNNVDMKVKNFEGLLNDDPTTFDEYDWNKISFLRANYDNIATLENYWRMFRNYVHAYETDLKKDLSMFKTSEVVDLLDAVPTSSVRVKKSLTSLLRLYSDWAINRGLNITANNVISTISIDKSENVNVRKLKNKYFSEDRIKKLIATAEIKGVNPQYFIVSVLAFIGLNGHQGSEIYNLKVEDINFDKRIVNVVNRETGKVLKSIKVDEWVMTQIEKAIDFTQETKKNTRKRKHSKEEVVVNYSNNGGYVVKPVGTKADPCTYNILRNRLIAMLSACNQKSVVLNDFFKSAKFNKLLHIYKQKKFLSSNDFKNVDAFYNIDKVAKSSWYNLKTEFALVFPKVKIELEKTGKRMFKSKKR